jgi:hypothetical protein
MNQRQFLMAWMPSRPSRLKRRTWFALGLQLHDWASAAAFPFRDPRLWWFCRRVRLHFLFGFPMPRTDTEKGILRA